MFSVEERLKNILLTVLTPFLKLIITADLIQWQCIQEFLIDSQGLVFYRLLSTFASLQKKLFLITKHICWNFGCFLSSCLCVYGKTLSRSLYIHLVYGCKDSCFNPLLLSNFFDHPLFFRQQLLHLTLRLTLPFLPMQKNSK